MSDLFQNHAAKSGPVECLGQTFPSDEARREHYLKLLAEKLQDPEFRKLEGFPQGTDEAILKMSDPPYYTACPNPFLADFVKIYGKSLSDSDGHTKEPFASDVSEGRHTWLYKAHAYHTKVPPKAIQKYLESPLAKEVLQGSFKMGDTVLVDKSPEGELFFSKKPKSSSENVSTDAPAAEVASAG